VIVKIMVAKCDSDESRMAYHAPIKKEVMLSRDVSHMYFTKGLLIITTTLMIKI